ncbi:SDR family NAD(P)-dependent oxidoreductase [Pseudonocardiaceae bacterium YIM PH 21723]|nr:SDR family NAD(P)-dependent oxidoreductase [Pseudonocardiaceae bacterium YIM PH 21723]
MGALDGRVAIITGAGRGIGREHALLFAAEGASLVINDLGGSNDGSGTDAGPAQQVADEIIALGGKAVANTDNVASWDGAKNLIDQAVSEFGKLDVLVNNAGILRDAFIPGMDEAQWDSVINVHLKGHFAPLHHAAAYWKDQSKAGNEVKGSVINTASASGTFMPNAGQANYGAAKAGIAALSLVAAQELERYGVRSNAIAPIARTRLTLATPGMNVLFAEPEDPEEFDGFHPKHVSPLVAYLATENSPVTGKVFAIQGGVVQELIGWQIGRTSETDKPWTIDDLGSRLTEWS